MEKVHTVTFETKCYENDWRFLLKAGRLKEMICKCDYPFSNRVLYINNVNDLNLVKRYADRCVSKSIIDSYVVVDDWAKIVLEALNVDIDSFKGGYYYSIQELTGIYLCKTDYLLHFSSDAMMRIQNPWIDQAIERMESNNRFLVATAFWEHRNLKNSQYLKLEGDSEFAYSNGFSDQCYLIKPEKFRANIYNEQNPFNDLFPVYGGELFEKRVNAYLRKNDLIRLASKKAAYRHRNFPKPLWKRWLWLKLGIKIE